MTKLGYQTIDRRWDIEVDGKDYQVTFWLQKRPPYKKTAYYRHQQEIDMPWAYAQRVDIYSRVGRHAGARELPHTSPVYKKVLAALIQEIGGWPS